MSLVVEPVLNELSVCPVTTGEVLPTDRLRTLALTLKALAELGAERVLRHIEGVLERFIDEGLTFRRALYERADRDTRLMLKLRLNKAPYVEELFEEVEGENRAVEAECFGQTCQGLGLVALRGGIAVSLSQVEPFTGTAVPVSLRQIFADRLEEVDEVSVPHAVSSEHVAAHAGWLEDLAASSAVTGPDLVTYVEHDLTRLLLCSGATRQLRALNGHEQHFSEVVRHLRVLNRAARFWTAGSFDPSSLRWSVESGATLEHSSYGPLRDFSLPGGGTKRRFSHHAKLASGIRIYFFAYAQEGGDGMTVLIGYVGPHLPTVKSH